MTKVEQEQFVEQMAQTLTHKVIADLEQAVEQMARKLLMEAMDDVVIVDDEGPSDEGQQGRQGEPTGEPSRASSESNGKVRKVNGNRIEGEGIYNPALPPGVDSVLKWSTTKIAFGKKFIGKSYQQAYELDKPVNFEWAMYLKQNSSAISRDYLAWLQEAHSDWTDDTACFIPGTSIRRTFVD